MEDEILPWCDVPQLIKFYEESEINYYGTYLILENFYKWHVSHSENEISILAPNGKIDDHGTFVAIFPHNCNILFDTKNTDFADLKAFLKKCLESYYKNRKWFVLGPIEERFWPMLQEVLACCSMKDWTPFNCSAYCLPKEEALLLPSKCPDEVYVGPIKEEHVELVNLLWPHRFEGSFDMIRMVVQRNGGVGIFLKENDSLVSWSLISQYNGPGLLQTVESQKRKGYGELAAITISKLIAEKGRHSFLYILDNNIPSQNLFHKLGYKNKTFTASEATKLKYPGFKRFNLSPKERFYVALLLSEAQTPNVYTYGTTASSCLTDNTAVSYAEQVKSLVEKDT